MAQIPTQYITLYAEKDTDFSIDLAILNSNRIVDDNLGNCEVSAIIRDSFLQDDPIFLDVDQSNLNLGLVSLSMGRDVTANLNAQNYSFDVYLDDQNTEKRTKLMYGILKVYI